MWYEYLNHAGQLITGSKESLSYLVYLRGIAIATSFSRVTEQFPTYNKSAAVDFENI